MTPHRNDVRQYAVLADEWWRPDGAFAMLHWLAEARAALVPAAESDGAVLVDERFVETAHRVGKAVHVWTVNETESMERLIDLGVDGIISDRPDLLRQVAGEKGIALPAGTPVEP